MMVATLSSCQLAVGVVATQLADGRIVIAADVESGTPPCIHSVTITKVGEGESPAALTENSAWSVDMPGMQESPADDRGCTNRIVYPEVPPGYRVTSSEPLTKGQRYEVLISGIGYQARDYIVRGVQ